MPGISLISAIPGIDPYLGANLERALSTLLHGDSYSCKRLYHDQQLSIFSTGYPEYPIVTLEVGEYFAAWEGYDYTSDRSETKRKLNNFIENFKPERAVDSFDQLISGCDGDYIVYLLDKKRKILWVANDPLGRLPLYIDNEDRLFCISREIKFIAGCRADYRYDRLSMTEMLLFGYTLGPSTLIEGISRVDAGELLICDLTTNTVTRTRLKQINLDELLDDQTGNMATISLELAARFQNACRNISRCFPSQTKVISLSGGFDSRCVLAGMKKEGGNVHSFTFDDLSTETRGRDSAYAKKVSELFSVPWSLVEKPADDPREMDRLLWIKDGMNNCLMAFLLPIFRKLLQDFPSGIIHLTGDNGDRSLDPQGAPVTFRSNANLVQFIIARHSRMSLSAITRLLGVTTEEIADNVARKISRYPEKNLQHRYQHFIFAERLCNLNFQAEDRNRTYFWHVTPFSSYPYFTMAMSTADSFKVNWKLYESFMRNLDNRCLQVGYANWNAPITSSKRYILPLAQAIYEIIPPTIRCAVRNNTLYRNIRVDDALYGYFQTLLKKNIEWEKYLNFQEILPIALKSNRDVISNLLTIVGYIAKSSSGLL